MAAQNRGNRGRAAVVVRYVECVHNHAAHLGLFAYDGCREFMPNGPDGTPMAFKCAACTCHRNFHRRAEILVPPPPRQRVPRMRANAASVFALPATPPQHEIPFVLEIDDADESPSSGVADN